MTKKEVPLTSGILVTLWNMGEIRSATDPQQFVQQTVRSERTNGEYISDMMDMHTDTILERLDERFDQIEHKIDHYLKNNERMVALIENIVVSMKKMNDRLDEQDQKA